MRISLLPISLGVTLLASVSALAQDWARFHGKDGTGTSDAKTIPVELEKSAYNWDVRLPGTGHSSPVVWGDKIFLTTTDSMNAGMRSLVCLSTKDGSILWKKDEKFTVTRKHKFNDYASSTPAVDKDRVYIAWSTPDVEVLAFDHGGKRLWKQNIGKFKANHGSAMSPVIANGMLLLGNQIEAGESFITALQLDTGKPVWKLPRKTVDKAAYGTPAIVGDTAIYSSTSHGITGIEIKTGKVLWEHDAGFSLRCVAKPVVAGDIVFASGGNGGGRRESIGIRVKDNLETEEVFSFSKHVPYVPSGVSHGELMFFLNDGGQVTCVNATDGDELWYERVTGEAYASPLLIDSKLYCFSREGEMVVLEAKDELEILARHDFGEGIFATPAIADGKMYVRTFNRLISVGGKK